MVITLGGVDIHHHAKQLTTTMKAVINALLASNVLNDTYWSQILSIDNSYACPELFVIIGEEMNLIWGGTWRKNIVCFPGDEKWLTFSKLARRGTCGRLYNRRFHIVATRWKDYKTLQFISSLRKTVITEVSRRWVQDIQKVVCPEYVTKYHQNMGGVDWGDQFRGNGAGLSS